MKNKQLRDLYVWDKLNSDITDIYIVHRINICIEVIFSVKCENNIRDLRWREQPRNRDVVSHMVITVRKFPDNVLIGRTCGLATVARYRRVSTRGTTTGVGASRDNVTFGRRFQLSHVRFSGESARETVAQLKLPEEIGARRPCTSVRKLNAVQ